MGKLRSAVTNTLPRFILRRQTCGFVAILLAAHWLLYIVWEHINLRNGVWDAGIFASSAVALLGDKPFFNQLLQTPSMADHFAPIIFIFSPLMLLSKTILWLMLAKFAAFAWSVYLLYRISRAYLKDERLVCLVVYLYLLNPGMRNAFMDSFQSSTLAIPFIFLLVRFYQQGKMKHFFACAIFLLLFKENLALVWVAFGFWLLVFEARAFDQTWQSKVLPGALILSGVLIGIFIVVIVTPLITHGVGNNHLNRFAVFSHIDLKLRFVFVVLLTSGLIPLLQPLTLIYILPALSLSLISGFPNMYTIKYHYQDLCIPFLFLAIIEVLRSIENNQNFIWSHLNSSMKHALIVCLAGVVLFHSEHLLRNWTLQPLTDGSYAATRNELGQFIREYKDKDIAVQADDKLATYLLDFKKIGFFERHTKVPVIYDEFYLLTSRVTFIEIGGHLADLRRAGYDVIRLELYPNLQTYRCIRKIRA